MKDNEEIKEETFVSEPLPPEDDTAELQAENIRRRREGKAEDVAAVQGALCIIAAIALVLLNLRYPDMAEELFGMVKGYSASNTELFGNPIDTVIELIDKLCQK